MKIISFPIPVINEFIENSSNGLIIINPYKHESRSQIFDVKRIKDAINRGVNVSMLINPKHIQFYNIKDVFDLEISKIIFLRDLNYEACINEGKAIVTFPANYINPEFKGGVTLETEDDDEFRHLFRQGIFSSDTSHWIPVDELNILIYRKITNQLKKYIFVRYNKISPTYDGNKMIFKNILGLGNILQIIDFDNGISVSVSIPNLNKLNSSIIKFAEHEIFDNIGAKEFQYDTKPYTEGLVLRKEGDVVHISFSYHFYVNSDSSPDFSSFFCDLLDEFLKYTLLDSGRL